MSLRLAAILIPLTFLAACGSSPSSPSPTAGSTTVTISSGASTLTTSAYGANPLTIATGTTISWLNSDSTTHTATGNSSQFSSGDIAPGGRFNFTFSAPGRYDYHCTLHPNMVGTIVVQ